MNRHFTAIRFCSLILSFVMILTVTVFAEDKDSVGVGEVEAVYFDSPTSSISNQKLETEMERYMKSYTKELDVSEYDFYAYYDSSAGKYRPDSRLTASVRNAVYDNPEIFWATTGFSFNYNDKTGKITKIQFSYSMAKEDIPEMQAAIEAEFEKISSYIIKGMSDVEKALAVHDYFCTHYEYDIDRLNDGTIPNESYTIVGVLVNKTGVCQSYALAYEFVLERLDVDCTTVSSERMNHMWNLVEINDEWYHVDVTWDDPLTKLDDDSQVDMAGRACHTYFMLSDETIFRGRYSSHYGWDAGVKCNSTRFEDEAWVASDSTVLFDKQNMYVAESDGSILAVNRKNNDIEEIYTVEDYWMTGETSAYSTRFVRLAMIRDRIYFNTDKEILSIATDGSDLITEYIYEGTENIFGLYEDDGVLVYATAPDLNVKIEENGVYSAVPVEIKKVELEKPSYTLGVGQRIELDASVNAGALEEDLVWSSSDESIAEIKDNKVVPKSKGKVTIRATSPDSETVYDELELEITAVFGDSDGDGKTNTKDAVMMAQELAGWDVETSEDYSALCDVYMDGVINTRDAVLIAQYLAGWNVSLGTPISE